MRDPWQITDYRIGKVILLHVIDRFDTAASGAPENPSESRGDGAEPSSAGPGTGGIEQDRQGALTASCTGRMRPREMGGREELVLCKGAPGALIVFILGA